MNILDLALLINALAQLLAAFARFVAAIRYQK